MKGRIALCFCTGLIFVALAAEAAFASDLLHSFVYSGSGAMALGDFGHTGNPDLVTCGYSDGIRRYKNAGNGALQAPETLATDRVCSSLFVTDMNKDGIPDIVAGFSPLLAKSYVVIILSKGDGTFASPSTYNSGVEGTRFDLVDVDGDGTPDVVLNDTYPSRVLWMKGRPDGTLAVPQTLIDVGMYYHLIADLNGDNKLDLVFVGYDKKLYTALGNGDGTFQAVVGGPAGVNSNFFMQAADIDNDHKVELIYLDRTRSPYSSWVMKGNGDGSFQAPATLFSDRQVLAIGDVNGDGYTDVVATNATNGFSVFYGPVIGLGKPVDYGKDLAAVFGAITGDLNGDGLTDVITGALGIFLGDQGSVGVDVRPGVLNVSGDAGQVVVGSVKITASGTTPLNISRISVDGPFSEGNTCVGSSLSPGDSCFIEVTAPAVAGSYSGSVTVTDNTGLGKEVIPLSAVITPAELTLSPNTLVFPSQKVGTISDPQVITVTNTGTSALNVSVAGFIDGLYSTSFYAIDGCPGTKSTLPVGGSCKVLISFKPTQVGTASTALLVTASAGTNAKNYRLDLSGVGFSTGAILQVGPSSLSFGNQFVGTSSAPQTALVSNAGDLPAAMKSVTATADFTPLSTCGSTVEPGQSCSVGVFFSPQSSGTKTGTLTVTDAIGAHTIQLTGAGANIAVTPASGSSTSATVSAGHAVSYSLNLAPEYFSGPVTLNCTGLPQGVTCSASPSSLTLSAPASITVNVTTTPRVMASAMPSRRGPWGRFVLALATVGLMVGSVSSPGRSTKLLVILIICATLLLPGCGGGTTTTVQQQVNPNGTPLGTYTLTLNIAASPTMVKSAPLTLVVQ